MPIDIRSLLITLIFTQLAFGTLLLYLLMRLTKPKPQDHDADVLFRETKNKSYDILSGAVKKADTILANAELRGIKLFSKEKIDARRVTEEYHNRVKEIEAQFTKRFETRILESEKSYQDFLTNIENTLQTHIQTSQKKVEDQAIGMINRSETLLSKTVQNLESQVKVQLDQELAQAKAEIESYKNKRLQILDQNIVEILEKTLAVTIGKKLSLADQSDLIYKALEEAKIEHALQ